MSASIQLMHKTISRLKSETRYTVLHMFMHVLFLSFKTRVIIKVTTHPCNPSIFDWFSWGWSKKHSKNKISKMTDTKNWVLQNRQFSIFFRKKKIGIGAWVSRIDWCKGHQCGSTYMVIRLSDLRYKTGKKMQNNTSVNICNTV